jgi:hypothetical protein
MKFPQSERLQLACQLERVVQGEQHKDGRRYLPLLIFKIDPLTPEGGLENPSPDPLFLGVVDRHHRVDLKLVGQHGKAKLVFLLGQIRMQEAPYRQGFVPETTGLRPSTRPQSFGKVLAVDSWEKQSGQLAFEQLYSELLLDVGGSTIGVRTIATSNDLSASIGSEQIKPGDWLAVGESRIDILGFEAD